MGTGWLAERSVYYAIDTSKPIAKDLAVGTVTELQLDVAWEKIAAAPVVTWRNLVNVSFLSWTVVRPVVVFVLPFWDMVWNSVEPLLMAAKESAMDSAEDAYFTLEESVGEELGPTFREWAKALAPVVRFPGNVLRAFVAVVVRPAVYFCTLPRTVRRPRNSRKARRGASSMGREVSKNGVERVGRVFGAVRRGLRARESLRQTRGGALRRPRRDGLRRDLRLGRDPRLRRAVHGPRGG